jgi:hypothetical protein
VLSSRRGLGLVDGDDDGYDDGDDNDDDEGDEQAPPLLTVAGPCAVNRGADLLVAFGHVVVHFLGLLFDLRYLRLLLLDDLRCLLVGVGGQCLW